MRKPYILAIDDDISVLRAVERDLKKRFTTSYRVLAVDGGGRLERITVRHHDTGTREDLNAAALFIFIGAEPHSEWLEGVLCRDGKGFLVTGANLLRNGKRPPGWPLDRDPYLLETSVPGVFAVGDIRDGAVRRVANSVGEGSIVLYFIRQYMRNR